MKCDKGTFSLSASDVANHLSCRHLTTLNLFLAKGDLTEPEWNNPHLRMLQERGLQHEKAYIASLRSRGLSIVDLSHLSQEVAEQETLNAMKEGAQAIVQASFASGEWRGRPDVLLRVEHSSALGPFSYEVVDCKLARETRAETILQLCLYSEFLAEAQGREPECFHVIRPDVQFAPESSRVASFGAYYRIVKRSLRHAVMLIAGVTDTYPEPVSHCDICRWWKRCDQQRRQDDNLCLVAGASRLQRKELVEHKVVTLKQLAKVPLPIPFTPSRGAREGYRRIREQARIQLEGRTANEPKYELLPLQSGRGLFQLPAPTEGDLFFDIEGDPFAGSGGLEYLFGIIAAQEDGLSSYECRWAFDHAQERSAFEWFIDLVSERLIQVPGLHIYHYGTYEPSAIKRLMLRYARKEEEVDRLLRGGVFVDLHTITRQTVIASVEQYSLKDLEQFSSYERVVPLSEANLARHVIEHQLERGSASMVADQTQDVVQGYNEDDCRATEQLRTWLEELRSIEVSAGREINRPELLDSSPSEAVTAHQLRITELFNALTADLPAEPNNRTRDQSARWLLAHALDWHRREEKVSWWEFFRLKDLTEEEMYEDKAALAGLVLRRRMPRTTPRERAPIDEYEYPAQECSITVGDTLFTQDEERFGEVVNLDPAARIVAIKKPLKYDALHPSCVFAHSHYSTGEQSESIIRLATWIIANGMDVQGQYRAARDLLLRNTPRLTNGESLAIRDGESVVDAACRIGLALDHSVLPIQGPPGAGKTYTGAQMICRLVVAGKHVGVVAVSHKVIRKLLDDVAETATRNHFIGVKCAHRKEDAVQGTVPVDEVRTNGEALQALQSGQINVLGGTAWVWSRQDFIDSVDVLFVDEAGQMSLANVLACAPAAKSLVLLGDPQQLEQPQRGSHPEGSDVSALAHLLNGSKTIDDAQGIFLPETWRLHPNICSFTSEMFYENRLASRPGLENQRLDGSQLLSGAGLWLVPVQHEGNQTHSAKEVAQVAAIVDSLTAPGSFWVDHDGQRHGLTREHILIVAPYNDQVSRLMERLPGARIGTVDKFQGQQGSVVIYSMTASTAEDAARGLEFLYDLNRFNVATSRARCACIVVASPRLLEPECRTPRQIELANALCRYSELSTHLQIEGTASATSSG